MGRFSLRGYDRIFEMVRQPLRAYLLSRRVTSLASADAALREFGEEVTLSDEHVQGIRLFTAATPLSRPPWASYVERVVGRELLLPANASSGALLLVPAESPPGVQRVVAFVFGVSGQHFLKRSRVEHGFGLRCALNACFPRMARVSALTALRSIDSKAFGEVALDTRQLASSQVGFEVFGMNIQTDLLRAIVGRPANENAWGLSVSGKDSFGFSVPAGKSLHRVARDLLRLWQGKDYRKLFPWVDNIQPVRDDRLIDELEEATVEAVRRLELDVLGPEELDLPRVSYYRIKGDSRVNQRQFLDLEHYVNRVGRDEIALDHLKQDWIASYDDDGRQIERKSVFECLAGDLSHAGNSYVIADGEFYAVDRDFIRTLDRFIDEIPVYSGLPAAQLGEDEDAYNRRAAQDPGLVLLDTRTIALNGRTTPVEPCDLFARTGTFIHVKRHVRSSTLSHLFSQGAVAAELVATNDDFRNALRDLIRTVESERKVADPAYQVGAYSVLADDRPPSFSRKVVFAIIARWDGRPAANVLPFFSKVNLRQRAIELERLGFTTALGKIDYPRTLARPQRA
jgi:uncharacterized protein (TIGR04141 family)